MGKTRKISKRGWAAIIAVALIVAIVLTGTLAWRSISQMTDNELMEFKNPGGRIHDYFNGLENKDVFAENFTDKEEGVNVFARIKILEYMETGEDAGINRSSESRKADPLLPGAKINDATTWHLHKPEEDAEADPFHTYWRWKLGGETVYMPTFNKNKDSLSVNLNGTYVGPNGIFDEVDPYEDYTTYTIGQDATEPAYYDADANTDDEYLTAPQAGNVPGGGGAEGTNFITKEETHTAKATQKTVAVLTMAEWEAKGCPIGNYWVWDTDGWAYWAEPIAPQTATGLLLDQVLINESTSEKAYYVMRVVGQFATKGKWGDKDADTEEKQGFYADGFTTKAEALLNKVAEAKQGKENDMWYVPVGYNVYQWIVNDAGDLNDSLLCAGLDAQPGTADDLTSRKVVYVEGGVTVGEKNYGVYFLEPDTREPYYRAMGTDELLGTEDDPRLWLNPADGTFPENAVDKIADNLKITAAGNATEMEKGKQVQLTAELFLNGTKLTENNEVTWKVTTPSGGALASNTFITSNGMLWVDINEPADELLITATSKTDDQVSKPYTMHLHGKARIELTTASNVYNIPAGGSIRLFAKAYHGNDLVTDRHEDFTWTTNPTGSSGVTNTISVDRSSGLLTVGRAHADKTVTVTASYWDGSRTLRESVDIHVGPANAITVGVRELSGATKIKIGGNNLQFKADLSNADQLSDRTVRWEAGVIGADGNLNTSTPGVTISNSGTLTVDSNFRTTSGTTIYVRAIANDATAGGASDQIPVEIDRPASVLIESAETAKGTDGVTRTRPARAVAGDTANPFQLKATLLDSNNNPYPAGELEWEVIDGTPAADSTEAVKKYVSTLTSTTGATSNLNIPESEVTKGDAPHKVKVKVTSKVDPEMSGTYDVNVANKTWDKDTTMLVAYDDWKEGNARVLVVANTQNESVAPVAFKYSTSNDNSWENSLIRKCYASDAIDDHTKPEYSDRNDVWLGFRAKDFWTNGTNADGTKGAKIYTRKKTTSKLDGTAPESDFKITYDRIFLLTEADIKGTINGKKTTDPRDYTTGVAKKLDDPAKQGWKRTNKEGTAVWWWLRSPYADKGSSKCVAGVDKDGSVSEAPVEITNGYMVPACWIKAEKYYGG